MKMAISNIGWAAENDKQVYCLMKKYGYLGLEIAPTRIFPKAPYEQLNEAKGWKENLERVYGFCVPSMQSIWYGRQEKIFGTEEERQKLIAYTKKAVDFAVVLNCSNLVFGCPQNRNIPKGESMDVAVAFFKEIGDYAASQGTVIGMEANPPIYNTNFINDTKSALELIKQVNSQGFLLNLDIGTMIHNRESISELEENVKYINHVHVSEPGLKPIEERTIHKKIFSVLAEQRYEGYISIEMGKVGNLLVIEQKLQYVREIID